MRSLKLIVFIAAVTLKLSCSSQVADKRIVLVGVDTLDRGGIATLLASINRLQPEVICLDIQFVNQTEHNKDLLLFSELTKCKSLVMATSILDYTGTKSEYARFFDETETQFLVNAVTGFTNAILENDNYHTLTRFSVVEKVGKRLEYHLGVRTAMAFDSIAASKFLANHSRVVDIDFSRQRKFKKYSHIDFRDGRVLEKDIKGKIVMLGYLGPESYDKFFTPLNSSMPPKSPDMFGVEYLAYVVAQVLEYAR